ncbi:hypothetical protein BDP27DRAFT_1415379 [Rhodocollybia butyracea]|uniref:Uncharacterized protein n=1 Tax=Rhodocollybia butyracea TaxID=206335 RepID=A0A9P5Q006_9AGAR|nr:hypothetical protein BDP27DRAFT_1415379 [Rhodocollybia butyracea]
MTKNNRNPAPLRIPETQASKPPPQSSAQTNTTPASTDSQSSTASFQMSPNTAETYLTSAGPFSASDSSFVFPPAKSYAELIGQARKVNKIAVGTCSLLDKIVKHLADAGPAIQAADELEKLQHELNFQRDRNTAELRDLEAKITAQLEEAIKKKLKDEALKVVKDKVRETIKNSINEELHRRVQLLELSEQTVRHPKQMLQVQADVANSEARARNAAVRASDESLRPLSLPDGKPHKQFPATIHDLVNMSANNLDALLKEYEVTMPVVQSPAPAQSTSKEAPKTQTKAQTQTQTKAQTQTQTKAQTQAQTNADVNSREEKINSLLAFIGVTTFHVVRTPSGKDVKGLGSVMVISGHS